ncbi:SDR family NAD(P)-dependent oxidoreductase [Shewanella sp. 202IG2-18]|uniref:SDR family NAD(P)-dependent oxidoreductase n=1 Tax=Parashewanella hymeniacidonis TaxID=2807618 RepID=UPI001960262D|nr:SDR family NAD(P)-dependent oxidoreductase [Parashewanella hymeniacidonis]MBM7072559.1 SDR family NAD(P)-dependent oxidoreductase [Parashewanella hymeniacidonis]
MSYIIIVGATGGLGQAITKELLTQKKKMLLLGRQSKKLIELQKLSAEYIDVQCIDVSDNLILEHFLDELMVANGAPTMLINCAGSGLFGQLTDLNSKEIESTLSNNLLSVINPCKTLFEPMKRAGGTMVNIMSTAALKGKAGESIYCAAKWGVRGFTESLREEAKGSKLRIVSVYPAGMNTPFWDHSDVDYPTDTFMSAEEAADMIVNALPQAEKGYISEITLAR